MFPTKPDVDAAVEPFSSQTDVALFRIPLWMDLSIHAVPAVVLLAGTSMSLLPDLTDIRCHRLLPDGETIQASHVDNRGDGTGCIIWVGILDLGRALRDDQWAFPLSFPQAHESGTESRPVCCQYVGGHVDFLGLECGASVIAYGGLGMHVVWSKEWKELLICWRIVVCIYIWFHHLQLKAWIRNALQRQAVKRVP